MLAENLVEEFEMKEDEPWYDHQDLQQDLQLAAELGKTLLDRNTELEDSLQHMYTTNQEQLQEIEYLTKQVELLRQMNEQHVKVYEQLDVTARELEETNQKLVADSKASQQKILSLTETIECLQTNIDHLQSQVEELKLPSQGKSQGKCTQKSAPSFSCLKELYDLRQHFVYDHVFAEKITSLQSQQSPGEEENEHLKKTVTMLQAQLSLERQKRVTVEEEYGLVLKENSDLEQQLGAMDAYRARALELEAEVAEMRQVLQSEHPFMNGVERLVPDSLFVPFKESGQSLLEEMLPTGPEAHRKPLKRSSSESVLSSLTGGDIMKGHEETCIRRAKAVKQRGISLLHEVDTQYSALKVKYEELLKKCQQEEDSLSHKAVQTSRTLARDPAGMNAQSEPGTSSWELASVTPEPIGSPPTTTPPEYKALFKEIFSCIKKTKQEIDEQRTKYQSLSSHS
ncbi:cerebellar degeneration-related protein 2 isoform X2 [Manis pentadactyla]|uniref:cerebellar degeneration-related protein 2 isoform X2 n=1 Tax=Manis pentadactyla TaxID=143292 RepID=UPI00255CD75F|nr:cerebellar degeneration-related protein 2 isoform X2 [Manis pentadactyla]KAI5140013.1 Cerebellar Degeneration-Related Protein 2 [Manis pentadactyla]